jgi:hypothetical protein
MPEQSKWTSANNGVIHKINTVLIPSMACLRIPPTRARSKNTGNQHGNMGMKHGYGYGKKEKGKGNSQIMGKGKGKGVSEDTVADFILKDPG